MYENDPILKDVTTFHSLPFDCMYTTVNAASLKSKAVFTIWITYKLVCIRPTILKSLYSLARNTDTDVLVTERLIAFITTFILEHLVYR